MAKKQHYMTWDERLQLEALKRAGLTVLKISKQMGFCPQTIYDELTLDTARRTWYDEQNRCSHD